MDSLLAEIKTCYVNDNGEKWTDTEELLAEHCEELRTELATLRERVATLENALVDTLLENKPTDATCACYGEENNCAWHRAFHLVGEKYLKAWEAGSDLDRTAGGEQ